MKLGRDKLGRFAAVEVKEDLAPGIRVVPPTTHKLGDGLTCASVVRGADTEMGVVAEQSKYDPSRVALPCGEITRKPEYARLARSVRNQNVTVKAEDIGW